MPSSPVQRISDRFMRSDGEGYWVRAGELPAIECAQTGPPTAPAQVASSQCLAKDFRAIPSHRSGNCRRSWAKRGRHRGRRAQVSDAALPVGWGRLHQRI